MRNIWKYAKLPLAVGVVASSIFVIDSLLGPALYAKGSFMWVAFVSWTIFSAATWKDRIKALIGTIIGFGFGTLMFHSRTFFDASVLNISVSALLFVFIANSLMMLFAHAKKIWMDNISGIFMGVLLCFSGLGVSLYPNTVNNAFLQLGIILTYVVLGLIAGMLTHNLNAESNTPKNNLGQNKR